jgi:hypothetical protein
MGKEQDLASDPVDVFASIVKTIALDVDLGSDRQISRKHVL